MSWKYSTELLESSLSSREPEAESSPPNSSSTGEPSARSNTKASGPTGSSSAKKKVTSDSSPLGMTLPHSTGDRGVDEWILSLGDFPVRTSVLPAPEKDSKESDPGSGPTWVGLSMRFDPDACGLRTAHSLFDEDLDEFSVILPPWGMMRHGELFQGPTPEPHTLGNELGSLRGKWATPSSRDWKDTAGMSTEGQNPDGTTRQRNDQLARQVYQGEPWPTPTKAEGDKIPNRPNFGKVALSNNPRIVGTPDRPKGEKGQSLESIQENIPTPTKGDAKSSGSRNTADSKANPGVSLTDYVRGDGGTGRKDIHQAEYVGELFPTPVGRGFHDDGAMAQLAKNIDDESEFRGMTNRAGKAKQDRHLPTPTAACAKGGQVSRGGERSDELLLGGVAQELDAQQWPTPTKDAANERNEPYDQGGTSLSTAVKDAVKPGQLNPDWVEWLMGWPAGWTSRQPLADMTPLPWGTDPGATGEVPRTARNIEDRVKRIEAIGDGQVPASVALAVRVLAKAKQSVQRIQI